jgi:hypothetical protein
MNGVGKLVLQIYLELPKTIEPPYSASANESYSQHGVLIVNTISSFNSGDPFKLVPSGWFASVLPSTFLHISYIYNIPLSLLPAQSYAGDNVHARSNIPMKNATNIAERLVAQFQTVLNMENIQELRKLYTSMRFGDLIQVEMCVEYICLTPVRLHWASCHHPAWQETTWPSNCTITDSVHSASPSKI